MANGKQVHQDQPVDLVDADGRSKPVNQSSIMVASLIPDDTIDERNRHKAAYDGNQKVANLYDIFSVNLFKRNELQVEVDDCDVGPREVAAAHLHSGDADVGTVLVDFSQVDGWLSHQKVS